MTKYQETNNLQYSITNEPNSFLTLIIGNWLLFGILEIWLLEFY